MAKFWNITEFGKLTNISSRMLRHYEKLGLLKPSGKQINGYRRYGENELIKIQQIMLFKTLGFKLAEISTIFSNKTSLERFVVQEKLVQEKVCFFEKAAVLLKNIISSAREEKPFETKEIIQIIEEHQMSENVVKELKQSIFSKILSPEELSQYIEVQKQMLSTDLTEFNKKTESLMTKIEANLSLDIKSLEAKQLVQEWLDHAISLNKDFYGNKAIQTKIANTFKTDSYKDLLNENEKKFMEKVAQYKTQATSELQEDTDACYKFYLHNKRMEPINDFVNKVVRYHNLLD